MSVWLQIVTQGLPHQGKKDKDDAEVRRLIAEGVEEDEATRRVYHPQKTIVEYRNMVRGFEAVYQSWINR